MKPLIAAAILAPVMTLGALPLRASADGLTVQMNGTDPAISAGYVIAQTHGFYFDEGLTVTLHPAGTEAPLDALARGQADLAIEWMPAALLARENGLPVVNIAQVFARPALRLTCRPDAGIQAASDLPGHILGSRFGGHELALSAWLNRLNPGTDGAGSVTLVNQWPGTDMLRQAQVACISTLTYAAVPRTADTDTITLDPAAQDAATLEDGLYVLQSSLDDPAMQDRLARFLRASMRGWREATRTPEATARELLGPDADEGAMIRQTEDLRVLAAVISPDGALDRDAYRRTVAALRAGPAPVLRHDPQGAVTDAITAKAAPAPAPAQPAPVQPRPAP